MFFLGEVTLDFLLETYDSPPPPLAKENDEPDGDEYLGGEINASPPPPFLKENFVFAGVTASLAFEMTLTLGEAWLLELTGSMPDDDTTPATYS